MLTRTVIKDCIDHSAFSPEALNQVYERIPATRCERKTNCCTLLPEASLAEILAVIRRFRYMKTGSRTQLYKRLVEYFFINPVKMTSCPFLKEKDCLIYPDRFFGCRAYGLWSHEYYKKLAECGRGAKIQLQQQWKRLGITLPQQVVEFNMPYCREVKTEAAVNIDDQALENIRDAVNKLSECLSPWHMIFQEKFFGDMSFMFSAMIFGFKEVLQLKYSIVRDILVFNNKNAYKKVIENISDFEI